MVAVTVKHDLLNMARLLDRRFAKQVPFATAVALTKTAQIAQAAVIAAMSDKFDRPTPFTLKSLFIKPATKANLRAMVFLKDRSAGGKSRSLAETLGHEFAGGTRERKRLEVWLERAGLISSGEFVVPGVGAKLDRYGNISKGQIQQVLSQLRAGPDQYAYSSTSTRSKRNVRATGGFFWSRGGRLPRGVWNRVGNGLKPVLLVIDSPTYRQLIDMEKIVEGVIDKQFDRQFQDAFETAVRTAR